MSGAFSGVNWSALKIVKSKSSFFEKSAFSGSAWSSKMGVLKNFFCPSETPMNKEFDCFEGGGFSGFFITKSRLYGYYCITGARKTPICLTKNYTNEKK